MALVVAADPDKVADRVIREMKRGATALHGRGMFMKQEREVLLIALTVTEIEQLKVIVREEDPHAFITVIPANEVVGQGFVPLGISAEDRQRTTDDRRRDLWFIVRSRGPWSASCSGTKIRCPQARIAETHVGQRAGGIF